MGGGQLMVFGYYPTQQDALDAIRDYHAGGGKVKMLVVKIEYD
jgi:hypothetical protein